MNCCGAECKTALRLLKALALGAGAGLGAAFGLAVPLAILNLYLAGHNITWPDKVHRLGWRELSCLDAVMLLSAMTVMLIVTCRQFRRGGKES